MKVFRLSIKILHYRPNVLYGHVVRTSSLSDVFRLVAVLIGTGFYVAGVYT